MEREAQQTVYATIANGMQILLHPDPCLPLVAVHATYRGGSSVEPAGRAGLAHLCEHLALRGPARTTGEDYVEAAERVGGVVNGGTFYDRIVFEQSLPADQLELGLAVEARRLRQPADPSPQAVERQRQILLREHHQRKLSHPETESVEWIQRLLYPEGHPYSSPPAGTIEGIQAIESQDVADYLLCCFSPERVVLSLAGNFEVDEVLAEVQDLFGPIATTSPAAGLPARKAGLPAFDGQFRRMPARVPYPHVYVAFRGPGYGKPGWTEAALWLRSLCLGRSSPLQRRLIDEARLAQKVKGGVIPMQDASTIILEAIAAPGAQPEHLRMAFVELLDHLIDEGVEESVMRRVRRKAVIDHYYDMQQLKRRADYFALRLAFLGELTSLDAWAEQLEDQSAADLRRFGQEHGPAALRLVLATLPMAPTTPGGQL